MIVQEVEAAIIKLPIDKRIEFSAWFDQYRTRVREQPIPMGPVADASLTKEIAQWETASDTDWLAFENELAEMTYRR